MRKNRVKIGILTFHRAINYGAVLQCYALLNFLNGMGYDTEVLDYACSYLEKNYRSFHIPQKNLKGIASAFLNYGFRKKRNRIFFDFRREYLKLSDERKISKEELSEVAEAYDYVCVGSDQVWNPVLTGWDSSFFLDFIPENKRVSYAASLGNNCLDRRTETLYQSYLQNYRQLSVREDDGQLMLGSLLNREVSLNIDPVFLLKKEDWEKLLVRRKYLKPYIFVYCLHEETCYEYALQLAEKKKIQIVSIPNRKRAAVPGKRDFTASVTDFLNYLRYADYVITDSFHASAFSVIFERQFGIVLKQKYQGLNSRLISLTQELGLENRIISNIDNIEALVDYGAVKKIIQKEQLRSREYFRRLEGEK